MSKNGVLSFEIGLSIYPGEQYIQVVLVESTHSRDRYVGGGTNPAHFRLKEDTTEAKRRDAGGKRNRKKSFFFIAFNKVVRKSVDQITTMSWLHNKHFVASNFISGVPSWAVEYTCSPPTRAPACNEWKNDH